MLQSFKDRIRGSRWLGYIIVGIISVPFALWGIQAYMGKGNQSTAATVNGEKIPAHVVDRQVAQRRQSLAQRFGGELPSGFSDSVIRQRVVDELITRKLLEQAAEDARLSVSESVLAQRIRQQQAFQQNGEFSRERYRQVLQRSGMTPEQYERQVRDSARMRQLRQGITDSSFVLPDEAHRIARLSEEERDVAALQFPQAAAAASAQVEPAAIRKFYESHSEQYQTPEKVRLAWIELDLDSLGQQVEISEEAVRQAYDETAQRYSQAAARKAAHILLKVPEDGGDQAREKVLQQARTLRRKLQNGADFAALARQNSQDAGSANQGGDLGYISGDMMPDAFETALFDLDDTGDVSEPVRTRYGYHLIKLLDVREKKQKSFEQVRDRIEQRLRRSRAESRFYERVETLKNTAYENPSSLDAVADATGLDVQRSNWVSRNTGGGGIGDNAKIREAAFSEAVLQRGRNSDVIKLGQRRVAVLRVIDRREPQPRPLDEVRSRIEKQLRSERIQENLQDWSEQIMGRLEGGASPKDLVTDDVEWVDHGWIAAANTQLDPRLVKTAFAMSPPGADRASHKPVTLNSGARAVVIVRGMRLPEADEQAIKTAGKRRGSLLARAEFGAWVESLRAQADIERPEQQAAQE